MLGSDPIYRYDDSAPRKVWPNAGAEPIVGEPKYFQVDGYSDGYFLAVAVTKPVSILSDEQGYEAVRFAAEQQRYWDWWTSSGRASNAVRSEYEATQSEAQDELLFAENQAYLNKYIV
jgi:hypothetical protein